MEEGEEEEGPNLQLFSLRHIYAAVCCYNELLPYMTSVVNFVGWLKELSFFNPIYFAPECCKGQLNEDLLVILLDVLVRVSYVYLSC